MSRGAVSARVEETGLMPPQERSMPESTAANVPELTSEDMYVREME